MFLHVAVVHFCCCTIFHILNILCFIAQSCPTLCDPMDCSPPGSCVLGDSPGKNTGVGCHALLHGIFRTQGSNPGLPHCRQILYQLSQQASPRILEWVAYPSSRGSSDPGIKPESPALQEILYQLSYQGSPLLQLICSFLYLGMIFGLFSSGAMGNHAAMYILKPVLQDKWNYFSWVIL